ncbi:TniQ family protein [Caballeronia sp. LjRoot31]|uniref:TniQ family protein n=1 Tax=Caballeronia sp. LjRoot31 TaxID=3342324 RepID=UPI003ED0D102
MTQKLLMTRSVLNPVAPIGVGTPEVESMGSYFCRLAMSHCISAADLGHTVERAMQWSHSEGWRWHGISLSGMSDTAHDWACALSKLTSVDNLHSLTLLPWRDVIAEQSARPASAQWCPHCLADDRAAGATPYFRLSWDVGAVSACPKHQRRLVHVCPDCGCANTRHKSVFVVPGWCTSCGGFLGVGDSEPATPAEAWIAGQLGAMLAVKYDLASRPSLEAMLDGIRKLVQHLDDGKSARFARRIGLPKNTVRYWLTEGGTPGLPALLRIASQSGLTLPKLLAGDLTEWPQACADIHDLNSLFPDLKERAPRKVRNWDRIRAQLAALNESSAVVSVRETARDLNVNVRQLYIHANEEARALAVRWNEHRQRLSEESRKKTSELIERVYPEIAAKGKAVNLREVLAHVPKEDLDGVRDVFSVLQEMKKMEQSRVA